MIFASSRAAVYYRSYSRALLKYANNGFFSRYLDAEDHAFIEGIRARGSVQCGSLADPVATPSIHSDDLIPRVALLEEQEFWEQPYALDKFADRRSGPIRLRGAIARPAGSTPRAQELRRNRELLAEVRAEIEAEEKQRQQRIANRQIQQLQSDIEWEKAAPKQRKRAKTVKLLKLKERARRRDERRRDEALHKKARERWDPPVLPHRSIDKRNHYVPQWKVDELIAAETEAKLRALVKARGRLVKAMLKGSRAAAAKKAALAAAKRALGAAAAANKEPIRPPNQQVEAYKQFLKARIRSYVASSRRMVTLDTLMLVFSINPDNKWLLVECCDELLRDGAILRATEEVA